MAEEFMREMTDYFKYKADSEERFSKGIQGFIEEGFKQGKEAGRAEGMRKSQINTVKTLLSDKVYSPVRIAELFGIPLSEVNDIASSIGY